ncbi:unnamed protein product [Caenorhabditis sp. 36 PRJEB53466]|nr:unnamed protein product [Caenorhabditis sp. 36 PRJEB53466]
MYSSFVLITVFIAGVEMCGDTSANCDDWVANGFCTSASYSAAQKQQYCGTSCGLCSSSGTTIAATVSTSSVCSDSVSSCATWNTNGFCNSTTYTTAVKTQYCAATCGLCGSVSSASDSSSTTSSSSSSTDNDASDSTTAADSTATSSSSATETTADSTATTSISSTCLDSSSACASWATNGYCTNSAYTDAQRKAYCAKTCNLC